MKKVIVSLSDKKQIITSEKNALKNKLLITYIIEVINSEFPAPLNSDSNVPVIGSIMKGIGGRTYAISKLEPVYKCCICGISGKSRVHSRFYCIPHYKDLVVTKPIINTMQIPKRNEPCHCGSKLKYKHCCIHKDHHTPRHYFLSDFKN